MASLLLDTTFLIDLQREVNRRRPGRACHFLEEHADQPVRISVITWGEFAEGFGADGEEACVEALRPYPVIPVSEEIAWRYGQVSKLLREQGERIGDNDLWIAATALHQDLDVVTRNVDHFRRVPELHVVVY